MSEESHHPSFDRLPEKVKHHVEEVARSSGLPHTDDSLEKISRCWFDKLRMFDAQVGALKMSETGAFPGKSPKGALLFTYSGSLLRLGTSREGRRRVEYASIGLRRDVPDFSRADDTELEGDAVVDGVLSFREGPIRSSSPLFKIVVCGDDVSPEEQEKRIREASVFLANGFVKINRTHLGPPGEGPGQFTMKSMIEYAAEKNGLSRRSARQVIEDFLGAVESGVLLGEKVRLGRLGTLFLTRRPARKARVGRHPITGKEITIRAKPERLAPRFAFSRYLREKALSAGIDAAAHDVDPAGRGSGAEGGSAEAAVPELEAPSAGSGGGP